MICSVVELVTSLGSPPIAVGRGFFYIKALSHQRYLVFVLPAGPDRDQLQLIRIGVIGFAAGIAIT